MKKYYLLFAVFLCLAVTCSTAGAMEFSGASSGIWSNVVTSGASDSCQIYDNIDSTGNIIFNWGDTVEGSSPNTSSLTFDGYGSNNNSEWTLETETVGDYFLVGDFQYRDGSKVNAADVDGVSLAITFDITDENGNTYSVVSTIVITFGDITAPTPPITYSTQSLKYTSSDVDFAGGDYTLQIMGFYDENEDLTADITSTKWDYSNYKIYASIVDNTGGGHSPDPTVVPEPATMVLFGTGILGLAGYRKRNKK